MSVRARLDSLFQRSGALTKPETARREWALLVYRNPDGSFRLYEPEFQPLSQTNCGGRIIMPDTLGVLNPELY